MEILKGIYSLLSIERNVMGIILDSLEQLNGADSGQQTHGR
jgi:hypothetical protein